MAEVRLHKATERCLAQKAWVGSVHCQANQESHECLNYSMSEHVQLRLEVLPELKSQPETGVRCRWSIVPRCHVQTEKGGSASQEQKSLEAEGSVENRKRNQRWLVGAEVRLKVYLFLGSRRVGRYGSCW